VEVVAGGARFRAARLLLCADAWSGGLLAQLGVELPLVVTRLPAAGSHDHTLTCLYTLPPDRDLVLGPVPGHDRVLVALGAAHGFKFAPLLGQLLADLALHGGTEVDLSPFAPDRPALTDPAPPASYLV
jgi:glycine/D-amino acid oxidase-like deaminating enzyme